MNKKYGYGKIVEMNFDTAIERVTEELKKEGFGILTDIDISATMKKKLGMDMPTYRILGACNPPLAYQAITSEPSIGLLLPCNVVVRLDEVDKVHVEFMDPTAVLSLVDKLVVQELAQEVDKRLKRALEAL